MKPIIALMAFMSVLSAINLSDRNFYSDEIKLSNPCLSSHTKDIAENGWFPYLEECQDHGIMKTSYGAVIAQNLTSYMIDSNGRISNVLSNNELKDVPKVKAKGYLKSDSVSYLKRIIDAMAYKLQFNFFIQTGDCINYQEEEVEQTAENLIQSIHYIYPFIHVVKTNNGWCFYEP